MNTDADCLPTIRYAIESFFNEFDFGEEGERTRLSYETGVRNFLRFIEEKDNLEIDMPINILPLTISDDYKAWMLTTKSLRPRIIGCDNNREIREGLSFATRRMYHFILSRLLYYWAYRNWLHFAPSEVIYARRALKTLRNRERHLHVQPHRNKVPTDFRENMIKTAASLLLPTEKDLPDPTERHKARLNVLRIRAIIHTLRDTALRVDDICSLTRSDIELACQSEGHLRVIMAKTNLVAHVVFRKAALTEIDAYIKERNDESPWVFIQHGCSGNPTKKTELSAEYYRRRKHGYGARFGSEGVRACIIELARIAGYDPESDAFVSALAFRHWCARHLLDIGVSTNDV